MSKTAVLVLAVLSVAFVTANLPGLTGVPIHEWLGVAVALVFLVHCALHLDWIVAALKSDNKKNAAMRVIYIVLDAVTLILLAVCTLSGILISGTVLPSLGLFASGYYFWNPLHALSAKALLAVVVVHVVLRLPAMTRPFRRNKKTTDLDPSA